MTAFTVILICLILSAFFSGMEIAFVSANRFKIEVDRKQGLLSANIIGAFLEQPSRFISALLVGNNIALVVYGITMAGILEPWIRNFTDSESAILVIQTILSTLLILVTAEFLPKAFFRINPNQMLHLFAVPAKGFYVVLYPLVWVIDRISKQVLAGFFKVKLNEEKMTFGRSDLDEYVNEFTSSDEEEEVDDGFGLAGEFLSQRLVLRADADGAGVQVALAHHDAADGDQRDGRVAVFFGTQAGGDNQVAAGLEPAIGFQADA